MKRWVLARWVLKCRQPCTAQQSTQASPTIDNSWQCPSPAHLRYERRATMPTTKCHGRVAGKGPKFACDSNPKSREGTQYQSRFFFICQPLFSVNFVFRLPTANDLQQEVSQARMGRGTPSPASHCLVNVNNVTPERN